MSSDMLSRMPEDIISNILSLMPTKYAVRTGVLSKRWRYSWMYVNNLVFDDIQPFHGKETFTKFVDQVLTLCKTSQVKLFRLHCSTILVQPSSISKWIDEAIKLNVNELDIQVAILVLPLSVFTCKTLTKLRLFSINNWELTCEVNLPCLKTLDIVVYYQPHVSVFKLISGCPMLESLYLEITKSCEDEEDHIFNIPTLKRLQLKWMSNTYFINKVVLNVPNLEYLFVGGVLCSKFVMEDVSSLVKASVSFDGVRSSYMWVKLLKGLNGVKSLSVRNPSSLVNFKSAFSSSRQVPSLKHLKLDGFWESRQILQFLESCPNLKHLCIERVFESFPKELEEYGPVPACMLTNLTSIKISKYKGIKPETKFLEYILGNANVLKSVTITWENMKPLKCEEFVKTLPRASKHCEIHFHGRVGYTSS